MSDIYNGIESQALWLLAENRFHNSKEFYEEHKEEIKRSIFVPLRQIASVLSDDMIKLDDKMNLNPSRMTSRIRRDTRFSKDKTLYREHAWIGFRRPKSLWENAPGMWFEISPDGYAYGIGYYCTTPVLMQAYRDEISEHPQKFREAVKSAEKAGFYCDGDSYKKEKPGSVPQDLRKYYQLKNMTLWQKKSDLSILATDKIIDELRGNFRALWPMYQFLISVAERIITEEE